MKTPSHSCYTTGCGHDACKLEHYRYMKRWRMGQRNAAVPNVGTVRRVQALQALGWPYGRIAAAAGMSEHFCRNLLKANRVGTDVWTTTARAIATAYDTLGMQPGPSAQTASRALRKGWLPPLAWDEGDLDDPAAQPYRPSRGADPERRTLDDVVIQRALNGQRVKVNPAERAEVIRRWQAAGRSLTSLEQTLGWNTGLNRRGAAA